MRRRITGCLLFIKSIIFITLLSFTLSARAEYYVVYPGPYVVCQSHCGGLIYKKHKVKKNYVKRHYMHKMHRCYRVINPCYRPCYRPVCHMMRPVHSCFRPRVIARPHCGSCGNGGYYGYMYGAEPIDASNVYPDMATGDDNPMFDPELNIDR